MKVLLKDSYESYYPSLSTNFAESIFREVLADFFTKAELKCCFQWLLLQKQYFAELNIGQVKRAFNSYTAEKIIRLNTGTKFYEATIAMCKAARSLIEFGVIGILTRFMDFFQGVSNFCGISDKFLTFLRRCQQARALNHTGQNLNQLLSANDIQSIRSLVHFVKSIWLPVLANEWHDFAVNEIDPRSGMLYRPDLEVSNLEFKVKMRRRKENETPNSITREHVFMTLMQSMICCFLISPIVTCTVRNYLRN